MPRRTSALGSSKGLEGKLADNHENNNTNNNQTVNSHTAANPTSRRQTRNSIKHYNERLDKDRDSYMGDDDDSNNNNDEQQGGEPKEDDDDDDDDEEVSLRRLSESYRKSRSASYVMDQSEDAIEEEEEEEPNIIVNDDDPSHNDSENSYDYDSEGDELMRSVEGILNRAVAQGRTRARSDHSFNEEDDFLEDAFQEALGGRLQRTSNNNNNSIHDDGDRHNGDEDDEDLDGESHGNEDEDEDEDNDDDDDDDERNRAGLTSRNSSASSRTHSRANLGGNSLADSLGRLFPEAMGGFFAASGFGNGGGVFSGSGAASLSALIDGLKRRDDPYLVLETLNELSEKILMMNGVVAERSLPVYKLSQNLIDILRDPILQEDLELQLVACRCLYNVLAVNNDFANEMVSCGAIEALHNKLLEISFIDLAEQALQTLEMISKVRGRDIMNKNCVQSVLEYLDFFTIHSQRKALIITANACQGIDIDNFDKIKEIFPVIARVAIEYSDAISVENSWFAISRIIHSFKRKPDLLEKLISPQLLVRLSTILPASCGKKNSSNNLLTFATSLKILNSLTILASSSSQLSMMILEDFKLGSVISRSLANYSSTQSRIASAASTDMYITRPDLNDSEAQQQSSSLAVSQVSIESLMAAPKDLILSYIKLIGFILPYVKSNTTATKYAFDITIGGFMSTEDNPAREDIRKEKISLYKQNPAVAQIFVNDILPLLITIYSSTVDYTIRRIVLIDLFRLIDFLSNEAPHNEIMQSNITNLLASIVIQSKTLIRREMNSISDDKDHLQSMVSKGSSKLHPYVLLLGAFLITRRLSKKPEYVTEFEREGLLADTSGLLKDLKSDVELLNDFEKQQMGTGDHVAVKSNPFEETSPGDNNRSDEDDEMASQAVDEDDEENEDDEEEEDEEEDEEEEEEEEEEDENKEHNEDGDNSDYPNRSYFSSRFGQLRSSEDNAFFYDGLKVTSLPQILTELVSIASDIEKQHLYLTSKGKKSGLKHMKLLADLTETLSDYDKIEELNYSQWIQIWKLFSKAMEDRETNTKISSFELISCGIVETLLELFRSDIGASGTVCYESFQRVFCEMFTEHSDQTEIPIILFVTKLQEALTRSESFEITTSGTSGPASWGSAFGVSSDSNNNSSSSSSSSRASVMAKQIKLRLSCDDNSMPEGSRQMLMTVHALGTFQGIHTFLKTRLQTLSHFTRLGNLSGMRGGTVFDDETDQNNEEDTRDYYIEFSINDEVIPDGTTIYGAIYRSLQKESTHTVDPKLIWSGNHVIKFRKVFGQKEAEDETDEWYPHDTTVDELDVLRDATTINILDLLKILFDMNRALSNSGASSALFINFKLTAKLNRQLEEPLVVSSGTLPGWSIYITRNFPFLFPIETRIFFLQSTSFGHSRLIQAWDQRTSQNDSSGNQNQSNQTSLGRPSRHKIRIARNKLFECAVKVLKTYASIPSLIEIEYFDEVGTGLGPTLEFYAITSREFSAKKRKLWREDDDLSNPYVNYKTGLFPAPIDGQGKGVSAVLTNFFLLGSFIARALLDSRIIDFNFNPLFFKLAKRCVNSSDDFSKWGRYSMLQDVKAVDPDLFKSLKHLLKYVEQYSDGADNDAVAVDDCTLEDLSLNFTLPGYPSIDLVPQGSEIEINASNVEVYIDKIVNYTVGDGVRRQIEAFTEGFSKVFPYSSMTIFSPEELVTLFGNGEEDWSIEVLQSSIRADHGYNGDSTAIRNLLEIMTNFTKEERRKFLQFLTGSPRLPIGGFKSLRPDLTVVRKQSEEGLTADSYLPSVMTCANYLKLPDYSSKEVMKARLTQAFNEGSDSFLLS